MSVFLHLKFIQCLWLDFYRRITALTAFAVFSAILAMFVRSYSFVALIPEIFNCFILMG